MPNAPRPDNTAHTVTGMDERLLHEGEAMMLTEFLLARLAEDEADAKVVQMNPPPRIGPPFTHAARVLAECEAKHRIVDRHAAKGGAEDWMDADWLSDMTPEEIRGYCGWCTYDDRTVWSPCPDLRLLALPYADHPDYREEWKP